MTAARTLSAAGAAALAVAAAWGAGSAAPGASPSPSPSPNALHRGSLYIGAAGFAMLKSATVVYPAGPGVDVATALASARARARYLESVYKMRVEVVADDRVTQAERHGNLLILGWGNRVWGGEDFPKPFTHGPDGLKFLGLAETNPGLDLLLYHANPLDPSSYILFWSRIDPERDRFLILPRIGSDWAMYQDFFAVRQGMFEEGDAWPPRRDALAESARRQPSVGPPGTVGLFDSAHYRIVYDRNAVSPDELREIVAAREKALSRAAAALGASVDGWRVLLNVYPDEAAKKDGSGVDGPSHSLPWDREIDMTEVYARSTSPHEEVHLVARSVYGPCYLTAIYEGTAIAVENSWRGRDMQLETAVLEAGHALPGLATLLDEERLRALPDDVAFGAAGALMAWMRGSFPASAIKRAYGLSEGTPEALAQALGTTAEALEASWHRWASACVAARKSDLDFMAAEADAQACHARSDWAGTIAALRRALVARPGDLQSEFNLASAQMRARDLPGAEETLKRMLARKIGSRDLRFRVFGHYQLGRVYDLAGRRSRALAEYDAVLALPDDHGSHELARERKASAATWEQLQ